MKKIIFFSTIFFLLGVVTTQTFQYFVKADSTPDSGSTSKLRELYDSLVDLGYGVETGEWGIVWNRIKSAAEWTPSGDVTASDVKEGLTFYNDSRELQTGTLSLVGDATADQVISGATFYANDFTIQSGTLALTGDATESDVVSGKTFYSDGFDLLTGTAPTPIDYSLQQYSERDNYAGSFYTGVAPEDYTGEESAWTDHSVDADIVWKDEQAGLYWSADRGVLTSNNFTAISLNTCDYFDENLYPTRAEYPGGDTDCGDVINYCAGLSYGGRTDWYLPTQQELMMAYIDGMYNQAGATLADAAAFTFGTTSGGGLSFWSSSEVSRYPTYAWNVTLYFGDPNIEGKTNPRAVRCVSRD